MQFSANKSPYPYLRNGARRGQSYY